MIDYGIVDIPHEIICMPYTMFIEDLEYGERKSKGGIIIRAEYFDNNGEFVRPRWGKVLYKNDEIYDVNVGDYILLKHGRWSTSLLVKIGGKEKKIWFISKKSYKDGLMAKSTIKPKNLERYL